MIVVVEGNIGAGKSTLLGSIGEHLASRVGRDNVVVIAEPVGEWCKNDLLKRFYEDRASNGLQLELTAVLSMVENERLAEELSRSGKFVVMERSLLTAHRVFGEMYRHDPSVSDIDRRLVELLTERFQPQITADRLGCKNYLRLYVRTSVQDCLERIRKRGRDGEEHITREYLEEIEMRSEEFMLGDGDHDTRHTVVLDGSYEEELPMSATVKMNSSPSKAQSLQTVLDNICDGQYQ